MDYCGPIGLPHSQFLSWSEGDQDAALAWMLDKAEKCGRCGSYPGEWVDEKGRKVQPPPMFARTHQCLGCVTIRATEDLILAGNKQKMPAGMDVYLSREPPPERDDEEDEDE